MNSIPVSVLRAVAIICAFASAATVYYVLATFNDNRMVLQTTDAQQSIARIGAAMVDAETGERGFLATGDRRFLEPYEAMVPEWPSLVAQVDELTANNATQQANIVELRSLIAVRMQQILEALSAREQGQAPSALAARMMDGKRTMDSLRDVIARMQDEERRLFEARRGDARRRLVVAGAFFVVVFGGVAFTIATLWMQWRDGRRRQAEQASAHAVVNETLQFAEQFIAILSHDLRNPLHSISAAAGVLNLRISEPADQRMVSIIRNNVERMSNMVTHLLDLTRSRLGGGIAIHPRPVELNGVIAGVVEAIRIGHPERTLEFVPGEPLDGAWDAQRVSQVVANLIANAIQHGAADSAIRITTTAEGDDVLIAIHNQGPAIPADLQHSIFEPFRRNNKDSDGLGLGLYIVRQITTAHEGTVTVASDASTGTTFVVRLPRHPRAAAIAPPGATPVA